MQLTALFRLLVWAQRRKRQAQPRAYVTLVCRSVELIGPYT